MKHASKTVMGVRWLGALLGGLALAALLAELLGRAAGLGALGGNPDAEHQLALTFDDGPGERTTELLAVLEQAGASATFFVLEDACLRFPAELQALLGSRHQTEAHGQDHRHALKLWPWQEWAQVRWHPRGAAGRLYRPPYGGHSPLTRLLARRAGRQIALWDVESRDWTVESRDWTRPVGNGRQAQVSTARALAWATFQAARPGSVVLLHDGPAVTPELLRELLTLLDGAGLKTVTLDELPTRQIGLLAGVKRMSMTYRR